MSRKVLARGQIRVDARRAVAKLRQHLLVDLHDYVLEIIRAAVAFGAREVAVYADADELMISWLGAQPPLAKLEQLLNYVAGDAASESERRLRLLALGVNAALGLAPRAVDVLTVTDAGRCRRVRFTPELVQDGATTAPVVHAEPGPADADLAPGSMRVHVTSRLSWQVLRRTLRLAASPEVQAINRACAELPAALTLDGAPWPRPQRPRCLLAIPLSLSGALDCQLQRGELQLTSGATRAPAIEFLEHGVLLSSRLIDLASMGFAARAAEVLAPLRVIVDAHPLPTNASRSALRDDAPLLAAVAQAIEPALALALDALMAHVLAARADSGSSASDPSVAELSHALGQWLLLAVHASDDGALARGAIPDRLLDCPLLRDGCGDWRSYRQLHAHGALYAHTGDAPLAASLRPWLGAVVWLRGASAEQCVTPLLRGPAELIIDLAQQAALRHQQFMDHAPQPVAVLPHPAQLMRERFVVEQGPYAGLLGEVAVRADRHAGSLRVFVEQRELCVIELSPRLTPLALDLALQWDGRIVATYAFDGVEQNQSLWGAALYGVYLAVRQAEQRAQAGQQPDDVEARLLRDAVLACWQVPRRLGFADDTALPFGLDSALAQLAIWPTSQTDRAVSLSSLCSYARRGSALCVVPPSQRGSAPDGRPVLALDGDSAETVAAIVGQLNQDSIELVPYQRGLLRQGMDAADDQLARREAVRQLAVEMCTVTPLWTPPSPALLVERPGVIAVVSLAANADKVLAHAGRSLVTVPRARRYGHARVLIDDISTIPSPRWDAVRWREHRGNHGDMELEYLHALVAMLRGQPHASAALFDIHDGSAWPAGPYTADPEVQIYLLHSARALKRELDGAAKDAQASSDWMLQRDAFDGISTLPLLTMLNKRGEPCPASLVDIARQHPPPGEVPFLSAAPGFATLSWHPLLLNDEALAEAFCAWSGCTLYDGDSQLQQRRQRARTSSLLQQLLLSAAPAPLNVPLDGAAAGLPQLIETDSAGAALAIAVANVASPPEVLHIRLSYQLRDLGEYALAAAELALVARFDTPCESHFNDHGQLNPAGAKALKRLFDRAVVRLAQRLVELATDGPVLLNQLAIATLLTAAVSRDESTWDSPPQASEAGPDAAPTSLRRSLRVSECWPTVQGTRASLGALVRKNATIYHGAQQHHPWLSGKRSSELDRPVVWLPAPALNAMRTLLALFHYKLRDVTPAIASLQRKRSSGSGEAPKLAGAPLHRRLRESLAKIGVLTGDGELEVVAGPSSSITIVDLNGSHHRSAELPIAIEAVIRIDGLFESLSLSALDNTLQLGARRLLVRSADALDALPDFARAALRRALLARLAKTQRLTEHERDAGVFADIQGNHHSLRQLEQTLADSGHQKLWVTTSAGPYPALEYGRLVLALDATELEQLRASLPLINQTRTIERDREAAKRAAAPPLAELSVPAKVGARAVATARLDSADLSGEVAFLKPSAGQLRAIHLAADGRPLCALEDGPGWPLYAVVNSRSAQPNRFFDGLRSPAQAQAIRDAVRHLAQQQLHQYLPSPADALAEVWVRHKLSDDAQLEGRLWLPAEWSARTRLDLYGEGLAEGHASVSLALPRETWGLDHLLPVAGTLLIDRSDGELTSLEAVALAIWDDVVALVRQAHAEPGSPASRPQRDAYAWDLALLGADLDIVATTTEETSVTARGLLDELSQRGGLWWSRQRGELAGRFPTQPPSFVLQQPADAPLLPLLRVLGARARQPLLRELGAVTVDETAADATPSNQPASVAAAPPADHRSSPVPATSWWQGLVRTVANTFAPPPPRLDDDQQPPLLNQLRDALALAPVQFTQELLIRPRRRGRPLHYASGQLQLNIAHDSLAPHLQQPPPAAAALLAAAALTELNRAHESIGAADELHALLKLMERWP